MPFDWQSIMAALGGRQPGMMSQGGPITGSQQGGPIGQPMQNMPQLAPGSTTPAQGVGGGFLGGGGGGLGLLGAGAAMLNASGPSKTPTNFGQMLGQGLGGFVQGSMADRDMAFQQQQQDSLAKIADIVARKGGGLGQGQGQGNAPRLLPGAMTGLQPNVPTLPSGAPAIPAFMANALQPGSVPPLPPNPMLAGSAPQQVPGVPPPTALSSGMAPIPPQTGIPNQFGGGLPAGGFQPQGIPAGAGGLYAQQRQNPFLALMMQRRGMMG